MVGDIHYGYRLKQAYQHLLFWQETRKLGLKDDFDLLSLSDKVVVVTNMGNNDGSRFKREDEKSNSWNC